MDYLRRHTAPVSERIWHALDEAVAQAARHVLAARRIATFDGPHGWEYIAARLGTMTPCGAPPGRAVVCVPNVVLLSEIRVEFSLPWSSIEVFERGAPVLDTDGAEAAAREAALAEELAKLSGGKTATEKQKSDVIDLNGLSPMRQDDVGIGCHDQHLAAQGLKFVLGLYLGEHLAYGPAQ